MKLNARKKHQETAPSVAPMVKSVSPPPAKEDIYDHVISLQFNTLLYTTLQNMIDNAYTAGDFTYTSVANFIRAALDAYQNGMPLTELDNDGDRRNISLRVTKKQHNFYKSLPNRLRRKLLERAVRSFMKL
jgi:hypothetical protein